MTGASCLTRTMRRNTLRYCALRGLNFPQRHSQTQFAFTFHEHYVSFMTLGISEMLHILPMALIQIFKMPPL